MFTKYDYSEYNEKSIVRVKFSETITDDNDFYEECSKEAIENFNVYLIFNVV